MAEEQKPVEVPKETAPATEAETKPVEATEAPVTAETPAEAPATETPAAAPVEEAKKEVAPPEEGSLEHKGLNFPKNFIYSKQFFWFGSDAVETKSLASYLKAEKSTETGHHNAAWASHTGKGLLFFGDKSAPSGVINLADATEPSTDGSNKFAFTSKGHKHTFKAPSAADRDAWVAQLKAKIAEAKELAATVTETEAYKTAIEAFKPAPPKKEEKAAEAPKEEAPKEETVAVPVAAAEETPKAEETKEEKKEEPKRRSASRKRGSIFGSLLGGKKEDKKEEKAAEPAAASETPAETAAVTEAAVTEPATEATPVTETAPATEAPAVEDKPAEAPKETAKPAATKRNSIFGSVFGKKEKKSLEAESAPAAAAKDGETSPTTEAAPVIPPVEATTPLAVEVASPATVPTETVEATPATNGESKKEVKAEKRKTSLPFGIGSKKEKAATSDEEAEKSEKTGPFSKLRATIKGRGKPSGEKPAAKVEKTEETPAEAAAESKPAEEAAAPATTEEVPKPAEEEEVKPAPVAPVVPAVTAAA